IDTGGWYKLCCPTSQLHKPDVLGTIYRVRRTNAPRVEDPRGLRLDWKRIPAAGLARLLDDARPAARRRAMQALARMEAAGTKALFEVVRTSPSPGARRNAVWSAAQTGREDGREVIRKALHDQDESVRQAAIHAASVWRDHAALGALVE